MQCDFLCEDILLFFCVCMAGQTFAVDAQDKSGSSSSGSSKRKQDAANTAADRGRSGIVTASGKLDFEALTNPVMSSFAAIHAHRSAQANSTDRAA